MLYSYFYSFILNHLKNSAQSQRRKKAKAQAEDAVINNNFNFG